MTAVTRDASTGLILRTDRSAKAADHLGRKIEGLQEDEFEVMFRLYAPTKALFEKMWTLPDVERVG